MNWDILKAIVILSALFYLHIKIRPPRTSLLSYWTMKVGLFLLLFASVLAFTDGLRSLDNVPILGANDPWHDTLEDQFGDIPGLAIFILGAFREILRNHSRGEVDRGQVPD